MPAHASPNTWDKVLGSIEPRISAHSFRTWFRPTCFLDEDASSLTVKVPNNWFADWLKTHYLGMIEQALRDANRPGLLLRFRLENQETAWVAPEPDELPARPPVPTAGPTSLLNPRYRFESFVVSSCNQFAHAAAMDAPSCTAARARSPNLSRRRCARRASRSVSTTPVAPSSSGSARTWPSRPGAPASS